MRTKHVWLLQGKPALWDAIQQPEEHGDDVEAFEDAPDSDAEEASKSNGLGLPALGATAASLLYDMQKRCSSLRLLAATSYAQRRSLHAASWSLHHLLSAAAFAKAKSGSSTFVSAATTCYGQSQQQQPTALMFGHDKSQISGFAFGPLFSAAHVSGNLVSNPSSVVG